MTQTAPPVQAVRRPRHGIRESSFLASFAPSPFWAPSAWRTQLWGAPLADSLCPRSPRFAAAAHVRLRSAQLWGAPLAGSLCPPKPPLRYGGKAAFAPRQRSWLPSWLRSRARSAPQAPASLRRQSRLHSATTFLVAITAPLAGSLARNRQARLALPRAADEAASVAALGGWSRGSTRQAMSCSAVRSTQSFLSSSPVQPVATTSTVTVVLSPG
jgi:hypothetical protein